MYSMTLTFCCYSTVSIVRSSEQEVCDAELPHEDITLVEIHQWLAAVLLPVQHSLTKQSHDSFQL